MAIVNFSLSGAEANPLLFFSNQTIKFILAKSLTRTAQEAQKEIRQHIRNDFVIRRKSGGFEQSIKILPATKSNLQAKIYTMAGFAALQQTGGIQKGQQGRLAVPPYNSLRDVKLKTSANKPRGLKNSFLIKLHSGAHAVAVRQHKQFKIMYYLKHTAFMRKRLNMLEIGSDTATRTFGTELQSAIREEGF